MHRHMIAHGDHFTSTAKYSAGIIAALFDVGRKCRAAQRGAHLFRNGVKQTFKDFQFNRIAHSYKTLPLMTLITRIFTDHLIPCFDPVDLFNQYYLCNQCSGFYERAFLTSRSAATNTKNTTAITPFMVKNAAFNLLRSSDATSECS